MGDDYEVSVEITATKTAQVWKIDTTPGATANIKDGDAVVTTEKTSLKDAKKTGAAVCCSSFSTQFYFLLIFLTKVFPCGRLFSIL